MAAESESLSSDERRMLAWAHFLCGLPAVLVACIVVCAVLFGSETPKSTLVRDYSAAGKQAFVENRFAEAELFYRKAISLEPFNDELHYQLGLVVEEMKDERRAWATMSRIAPETTVGYGLAHLWQAVRLYDVARTPEPPANIADRLEHHLAATIKRLGRHQQAHMMLGQLYLTKAVRESDAVLLQKARDHLSRGADAYPENRLSVAELHRRMGQSEQAKQEATKSLEFYQQRLKADPKDLEARLRVAMANKFLLRYGSAIRTLREGLPLTDDPRLREALANAYLTAARAVGSRRPDDVVKQVELLEQALTFDPDNPTILATFAVLTGHSDPAADAAKEKLLDILAEGKAPATVHLILGSIAIQRGNDQQATYHLDQALALNPRMPEVLNNLAWHLANLQEPKLERALELIDRAVESRPGDAEIRDTRGQILLKLGRHQRALSELLISVRHFPERRTTHQSLAKIYQQLGDEVMAKRHQGLAKPAQSE